MHFGKAFDHSVAYLHFTCVACALAICFTGTAPLSQTGAKQAEGQKETHEDTQKVSS